MRVRDDYLGWYRLTWDNVGKDKDLDRKILKSMNIWYPDLFPLEKGWEKFPTMDILRGWFACEINWDGSCGLVRILSLMYRGVSFRLYCWHDEDEEGACEVLYKDGDYEFFELGDNTEWILQ